MVNALGSGLKSPGKYKSGFFGTKALPTTLGCDVILGAVRSLGQSVCMSPPCQFYNTSSIYLKPKLLIIQYCSHW